MKKIVNILLFSVSLVSYFLSDLARQNDAIEQHATRADERRPSLDPS